MTSILTTATGNVKPIFISTSQTPEKLTIIIDRNVHFNTIIHNGLRINQSVTARNIVNSIEQDGKVIGAVDMYENAIAAFKEEALTSVLANFISFSNTEVNGCLSSRGYGRFNEPLEPNVIIKKRAPPEIEKPTTFEYFYKLPQELKDMVLDAAVEPHVVVVYRGSSTFAVNIDRKWAEITLFHVCREWRRHAIARFGVPKRDRSFPFDPRNDSVYLRTYSRHRLAQILRDGGCRRRPVFQVQDYSPRRADPDLAAIDHDLWDRVRTVELEARVCQETWFSISDSTAALFRKVETWRILILQLDTCRYPSHSSPQALFTFQKGDYNILKGVMDSVTSTRARDWKPKVIEICREGYTCAAVRRLSWKHTRKSGRLGEISCVRINDLNHVLDDSKW